MDLSVFAAVTSFFMSERVLKPKATILGILGCILAYDLTSKTHDIASLRVYRGPGLLAFTLMMVAYSLRTWRRNGVACDELLFLPGTPHGLTHGIDSQPAGIATANAATTTTAAATTTTTTATAASTCSGVTSGDTSLSESANQSSQVTSRSEGDVAAGVSCQEYPSEESLEAEPILLNRKRGITKGQMRSSRGSSFSSAPNFRHHSGVGEVECNGNVELMRVKPTTARKDSFDSSIGDDFATSWDDSDHSVNEMDVESESLMTSNRRSGRSNEQSNIESSNANNADWNQGGTSTTDSPQNSLELSGFEDSQSRISRIGTFFFFRPSNSNTDNAAYAPSGPAVVGAALDLSMPVVFNFHLFIEAFNHVQAQPEDSDETPAKILPIIFLSILMVRSFIPPGRRGRFWSTIKFTVMSPFHRVRFRDAYIGDVMTSLVRPFQDILFALSYYFTVVWGSITDTYGMSRSGEILEQSWLLHNVVLPSCALLPLWWKFLQTLRQAYDENKRWPHYANAFKYLTASLVILSGMTHREHRRSLWWIFSFFLCLLYQLWCDIFIDWELFTFPHPQIQSQDSSETCFANISSLQPNSHILLALQMHVFTPMEGVWRKVSARVSNLRNMQLRSRRLYKSESFYMRICAYNAVMRFAWMVCFIPSYRLSETEDNVKTFKSDVDNYMGVLLPAAEIVRRMFWGILFLEKETIKMTEGALPYAGHDSNCSPLGTEDDESEEEDFSSNNEKEYQIFLPLWLNAQQQLQHNDAATINHPRIELFHCSEELIHNLFLAELGAWVLAFVTLGCWAAS